MIHNHNYCIILAGGIGMRFWPVSRESRPKQFHPVSPGGKTLLRETFERFATIFPLENILVLSLARYKELVMENIPELPEDNLLLEPYNRNTAPAIAYAAYTLLKRDPDAVMVATPSDHVISDMSEFSASIEKAVGYAQENESLITLGIIPDGPDTNFGYIQGEGEYDGNLPLKVKTFTEKPSRELAEVFLSSGEFYWNSGIFVWKAGTIRAEMELHAPEITRLFVGWEQNIGTAWEESFLERVYTDCPKISVDYAVMEKTEKACVFPAQFGWHDVGSWDAMYSYLSEGQPDGNAHNTAKNITTNTKGTLVFSNVKGKLTVVKGLEDYLVVDTEDVLLICPRTNENIKELAASISMPDGEEYR